MEYKKLLEITIRKESNVYNYETQFRTYLNKLDEKKDFEFLKFLASHRKKGISIKRLINLNQIYFKFLNQDYYNLSTITENDFEFIYTLIFNSNLSNSSKITYLRGVKQILKFYNLHKKIDFENYKIKEEKKPLMSEDLMTEDEKHIIISRTKGLQHRVFLTILFDTGLRVGEVFSIDRTCFQKVEKGYIVTIKESKTNVRSVFTYSHNDLIEKLLKTKWEKWSFRYRVIYNLIKKYQKEFNKRLYPHLARHTKATELSQKLTEQELKNYFGWSPDSKMLNNYIHLNNKNVINKLQNLIS